MAASTRQVLLCLGKEADYFATLSRILSREGEVGKRVVLRQVNSAAEASKEDLQRTEVLLGSPDTIGDCLPHLKSVKWIHCVWAGVNPIVKKIRDENLSHSFKLTRAGGMFGPMISEYVIGYIIASDRRFFAMRENQKKGLYLKPAMSTEHPLSKLTVGILGVGDIGRQIAKTCKFFEMTVCGLVNREPALPSPHIDHYRTSSELKEMLSACDYICNILPSTPQTVDLLSGDVLECCKEKSPVFINVGRGDVIGEDSIVKAIRNRWISKAVLDVFQNEPLPRESPLWDTPEVFITPHMSGPTLVDEACEKFVECLKLYLDGKPLPYEVDFDVGY